MNIAIVMPALISTGPRRAALRLYKGLKLEGYEVDLVKIQGNASRRLYEDIKAAKNLQSFDVVIYMGSNLWLNPLFIESKKGLFVHGFVWDEFLEAIKQHSIGGMVGRLSLLSYWKAFNFSKIFDFFIFHSRTAHERNGIPSDYVILPQFILPDDLQLYSALKSSHISNGAVRIVTYTSFVSTPRILGMKELVSLAKKLIRLSHRKIEFIIINPIDMDYSFLNHFKSTDDSTIKILPSMPREEFLKLMSSSDLYVERCLDEELGYVSIEAGLMGVPIAKVTLPEYFDRQDYNDKEVILARSLGESSAKIAEYVENIDLYKRQYTARMQDFLMTKRSWDNVKTSLLSRLR